MTAALTVTRLGLVYRSICLVSLPAMVDKNTLKLGKLFDHLV